MQDHLDAAPQSRDTAPSLAVRSRRTDQPLSRPVARESLRRAITELRDVPPPDPETPTEHVRLLPQLHDAVVEYVDVLRADGETPERMLRRVKDVVKEAELADIPPDASATVMAKVVRWSIEAYYDEPSLRGVPRFF